MVSGPKRPINIKKIITTVPASDKLPVNPLDSPTVPRAEIASKTTSKKSAFSVIDRMNIAIQDTAVERRASAKAFPLVSLDSDLPNTDGDGSRRK